MEETLAYAASDIVVLEGLEAVRRRPGMYIGDVHDGSGLHHLLWEVVANSIDEHLAGHATRLRVSIEGDLVEVEDDGRGISVDEVSWADQTVLERAFTTLHAGATLDGHAPHVHVAPGGFGVGLAVVNALSQELEVTVWRQGLTFRQRYAQGRPQGTLEKSAGNGRTGTRVRFRPDASIFTSTQLDVRAVRSHLEELALWNPGLRLELMSESLQQPRGTVGWVERIAREHQLETLAPTFVTRRLRSNVLVEIALAWSRDGGGELRSFASQNQTQGGGSHVTGFWQGLIDALSRRRPQAFSRPPRASRWRGALSSGLVGVVHVALHDPRYAGPCRERLENVEARDAVRGEMAESFGAFLAEQPELEALLFELAAAGSLSRARTHQRMVEPDEPAPFRRD